MGSLIAVGIVIVASLLWIGWFVYVHLFPINADHEDSELRHHFRHQLAWLHHHVVLVLLIFAVFALAVPPAVYQLGYTNGVKDAAYFRNAHPKLGFTEPRTVAALPIPRVGAMLPQGVIPQLSRYPGVGNQALMSACGAWETAWLATYEYRIHHPLSWMRYSPRCVYDGFSNQYSGGQDKGSAIALNVQYFMQGAVSKFKAVPYGANTLGLAPYAVDTPTAPGCYLYGVKKLVTAHPLTGYSEGQGQAAVDYVRMTINGIGTADGKGHPVGFGLRVTQEYDNATIQPNITAPVPGVANYDRGGHGNVVLAYDDTRLFPDGTVGGFLVQNQWGTYWGLGGRAWISYDYFRKLVFDEEYLTIAPATTVVAATKPPFLPNPAPGHSAPSTTVSANQVGTFQWTVGAVPGHEGSRTINLASSINYWGTKYHVWPVALAATIYTESAGNVYAYRWQGGLDKSCGLMQVIVANIAQYERIYDPIAACQWEYNPSNSVMLGARMLHECDAYQNYKISWPYQYVGYNAGCGNPASFFYNPTGQAATNFYGNFLPNYNYALSHFAGSPPAFPVKAWGRKPYKAHGKLTWPASHYQAAYGRYLNGRYVNGRLAANRRMLYLFSHARMNCYFKTGVCRTVRR